MLKLRIQSGKEHFIADRDGKAWLFPVLFQSFLAVFPWPMAVARTSWDPAERVFSEKHTTQYTRNLLLNLQCRRAPNVSDNLQAAGRGRSL